MIFGFLKELSVETFSARNSFFPSNNFWSGFINVPSVLMGQNKNTANRKITITMGRIIFFALDNAMVFILYFGNDAFRDNLCHPEERGITLEIPQTESSIFVELRV
jgi:hypothetical protein